MEEIKKKKISKFLSFVLRHHPETIHLSLDENGWAMVSELMEKISHGHQPFSKSELEEIVATNEKKRFAFNADHTKIRASQGHSFPVNLSLHPTSPPPCLYHGTATQFLDGIRLAGLQKMDRQFVHLSSDFVTAEKTGSRKGKPVVLTILAEKMQVDGFLFYISENGVWLCEAVPAHYIQFS